MGCPSVRFPEPIGCTLWSKPELARAAHSHQPFETVTVYQDSNHFRRCLLRCRECGQLYFYEMLEKVDYIEANDPQYRTYIPVACEDDAERLSRLPVWHIAACTPAIHSDWPQNSGEPKLFWVRG